MKPSMQSRKNIVAVLAAIFAVMLAVSFGYKPVAKAATADEVHEFYLAHASDKTLGELDPNDTFAALDEMFAATEVDALYEHMRTMVAVADAVDAAYAEFSAADYDAADFQKIDSIFSKLKNRLKFSDIGDEKFADSAAALERVEAAKAEAAAVLTRQDKLDAYRASSLSRVADHRARLLAANTANPEGAPESVAGFYDEEAKNAVLAIEEKAIADAGNITLATEAPETKLDDISEKAVSDMNAVERNDIERAIGAINDYHAALAGSGPAENAEAALESAREAVKKAKDGIIANASDDVKKFHDGEISLINAFETEDFVEAADREYTATVSSDDGVVTVTAKLDGEDYPAFIKSQAVPVTVKIYTGVNGAGMRNAINAVGKIDKKLGVAYFFYIEIYSGAGVWKRPDNADIKYEVAIDLEGFYKNYVADYDRGAIEKFLSKVPAFRSKLVGKDRADKISEAEKYINGLSDKGDRSLVYRYYRNDDGQGAVAALENCRIDGGKLMFTTTDMTTFAASMLGANSILTSPLFWLIVALAIILIVVILIIVIRNLKYTFKFVTDGGTPVKPIRARKNECFPMPEPPVKEGYVFGGWYADKECTVRFIDTYVLKRKSKKIYAKWYEETVPAKFVRYYEKLRNEILCYAKAGPLAGMGVAEHEVLARLFADKQGTHLNVALPAKKLENDGYDVVDDSEVYEDTPAKISVANKETFRQAMAIIHTLMERKGLQNVGPAEQPQPMTMEERENGFTFEIYNDRVARVASDFYELLRVYTKSFALYDRTKGAQEGDVLARIYCKDEEQIINLYLALPVSGLLAESDRFEDTPALFCLKNFPADLEKAYDYVDRVMEANGLQKRNENANRFNLAKVESGCGTAFVVTMTD